MATKKKACKRNSRRARVSLDLPTVATVDLPDLDEELLRKIVQDAEIRSVDDGTASPCARSEARAKLEVILWRCNQYMPLVMRYKRLLDQTIKGDSE